MKWRETLGGVAVTVVSGVSVFYLTREPPPPPPIERLTYRTDAPVCFESKETKLCLFSVVVRNSGNKSASGVTASVELPGGAPIKDRNIRLSTGAAGKFESETLKPNVLRLSFPSLAPQETATATLLSDKLSKSPPTVGLKSSTSLGTKAEPDTGDSGAASRKGTGRSLAYTLLFLLPLGTLIAILLRLRAAFPSIRSVNNTAFVLLHSGMAREVEVMLRSSLREKGGEPVTLSNYALSLALKGESQKAAQVLDAAEFWCRRGHNRHELGVIQFNRALLHFHDGDQAAGVTLLRDALENSPREVRRYLQYSALVRDMRQTHPELRSLLDGLGIHREQAA